MRFYRPRSILILTLLGFCLVSLPFILALISTALSVNTLARQTEQAMLESTKITQTSYRLTVLVDDMEKDIQLLQNNIQNNVLERYRENHNDVNSLLQSLTELLPDDQNYRLLLDEFKNKEEAIFKRLNIPNVNNTEIGRALVGFNSLAMVAEQILSESHRILRYKLDALKITANNAEQMLVWQAISLGVVAFILAGFFTILITQPIRQLDQAIRDLGNAAFTVPIKIKGPDDLVYLGERLDWLRLRLLELEAEKNRFLRHVSHELKTPLAAIREGTQLMIDEVAGGINLEQRGILDILHKNSLQLQHLIENLLDFSAAHFKTLHLQCSLQNIYELIEQGLEEHSLAIKTKTLRIEKHLSNISVIGDREKLLSIIDNLLSNAIKFSPSQGVVTLRLYEIEKNVVFEVEDSGIGISEQDKPKIFDAFYQGQNQSKGAVKGSGLGLSIVKEYVEAHQGTISLIDTQNGKTCFRITLSNLKG
jgi:two-component system, NtrC family, sensor histidine kinase GlrK